MLNYDVDLCSSKLANYDRNNVHFSAEYSLEQ